MITLRPHQLAAVDAVENAFRAGITRPLIDSCVGSGKSLMFAELARREIERGGRVLICAHVRELVQQNADACRSIGLQVGINAAALGERTWRAPVISAAVQSIFRHSQSFGPITMLGIDEAHLLSHGENGMYRELHRALGFPRMPGASGTIFRLQGGSLVEGESAPFEKVVYRYSILDGIRDGYLCPAFSLGADDKMDPSKLRTRQGEFTGESQDVQMIAMIDNHVAQMVHHGRDRKAWLIFEASTKAAHAMTKRMNEWGIPTGLVLGETPAGERIATVEAFRSGRLRALVNLQALTTGFNVPAVDMLVMRRRTKSLGLYVQMCGRALRAAPGKDDCVVLDFADNINQHGALDFLRPKDTVARLASCDACGKRNAMAAARCWSCDEPMTKLCPACLCVLQKGTMDCTGCGYDMRVGDRASGERGAGLLETPSGAALIASYKTGVARDGGWLPILRVFGRSEGVTVVTSDLAEHAVGVELADHARAARWLRVEGGAVVALLVPNGANRNSVLQVTADGAMLPVPMPRASLVA